mgnify:CR=1 FL=1
MPIISTIGRRSPQVRLLVWTIYGLLIIGATTMVYPFLLMLSGSTKSSVDSPTAVMVPQFMRSDAALYRKHVEALFNEHLEVAKNIYQSDDASFRVMQPPAEPNAIHVDAWPAGHPALFDKRNFLDQPLNRQFSLGNLKDQSSLF